MSESDQLLVRALGAADSLRLPIRRYSREHSANRMAGLQVLDTAGVPLAVGGASSARGVGSRMLADLERDGLIRTTRAVGEKLVSVALTEAGDLTARALCGLPTRSEAREFLEHVAAVEARCRWAPDAGAEKWIAESAVLGGGWGDGRHAELAAQELYYCAAAARGWMRAHSVYSTGWAAFALTGAGREELATPTAPPVVSLPPFDRAAEVLFARARDEKLRELEHAAPNPAGELGHLPLGVYQLGHLPGTKFDDDDDKPRKPTKPRRKR